MFSYPRIIAEGVDHRRPARACFLQAVNEKSPASALDRTAATEPPPPYLHILPDSSDAKIRAAPVVSRAINIAVGALRSTASGKVRLLNAIRSDFIGSTKIEFCVLARESNRCRDRRIKRAAACNAAENADFLERWTATSGAPTPLTAERVLKNVPPIFKTAVETDRIDSDRVPDRLLSEYSEGSSLTSRNGTGLPPRLQVCALYVSTARATEKL